MKTTKKLNKKPVILKVDKKLDEYLNKGLFEEKIRKANEVLKTLGIPKFSKWTKHSHKKNRYDSGAVFFMQKIYVKIYFTDKIKFLKLSGSFMAISARIFLLRVIFFSFNLWMNWL